MNYFDNLTPSAFLLELIPNKVINLLPFFTVLNFSLLVIRSVGDLMKNVCRCLPVLL